MNTYMTVGRAAMGENEVLILEANSHKEAAEQAAKSILSDQHEGWNDDIYIDVVTDKDFNHEMNFMFSIEELTKESVLD